MSDWIMSCGELIRRPAQVFKISGSSRRSHYLDALRSNNSFQRNIQEIAGLISVYHSLEFMISFIIFLRWKLKYESHL
jgi:hypothetical protein